MDLVEPWEDIDRCSYFHDDGGTCGAPAVTFNDARAIPAYQCVVGRCVLHRYPAHRAKNAPEISREEAEVMWVMSR